MTIVDRQLALCEVINFERFIHVLERQITDLKDEASVIIGKIQNSIQFSNVPLYEEDMYTTPLEKKKIREVNKKLKELLCKFQDMKEEIYKL